MFKKEQLGITNAPYMIRYVMETKWFSIRLHHWLSSDDLRNPHDHAWNFITFVLSGSYEDISAAGTDIVRTGNIRYRKYDHKHSVKVPTSGCWTLMFTGPDMHKWGFWVNGKFRKRNKYFYEHGKHTRDGYKRYNGESS